MAKITGLGGVFLKSGNDSKELLKWYRDVLELDVSEYGINFLEPNLMTLITFGRKSDSEAVLNFTVDDLEEFIDKLKNKGVTVRKEITEYEFGSFAQVEDAAGNVIELCRLDEEKYRQIVQIEVEEFKD